MRFLQQGDKGPNVTKITDLRLKLDTKGFLLHRKKGPVKILKEE